MKSNYIKIKSILGTDIRIRSRVFEIVPLINSDSKYTLDFEGVEFISRSFADELVSLQEHLSNLVDIVNLNTEVGGMIDIVKKGRQQKYKSARTNNIIALENMNAVEMFFGE